MVKVASSKMFPIYIDIYYQIRGLLSDGSFAPTYPILPDLRKVPCSISYKSFASIRASGVHELDRITQVRRYEILTPIDTLVSPWDKIIYIDLSRNSHELFVDSHNDTDGLGIHWTIEATEKV